MTNSRIMRALQAAAGMMVLAAVWQILSMLFPPYLFPPVPEIIARTFDVLVTGSLLIDVLHTAGRIFGGLFGAFILGAILALLIGHSKTIENFVSPVLTFWHDPAVDNLKTGVAEAKKILQEAGYRVVGGKLYYPAGKQEKLATE